MKTLEEIKEEVAQEHGFEDWEEYETDLMWNNGATDINEVAKRYAREVILETIEICEAHTEAGSFGKEGALANSLNILKQW